MGAHYTYCSVPWLLSLINVLGIFSKEMHIDLPHSIKRLASFPVYRSTIVHLINLLILGG